MKLGFTVSTQDSNIHLKLIKVKMLKAQETTKFDKKSLVFCSDSENDVDCIFKHANIACNVCVCVCGGDSTYLTLKSSCEYQIISAFFCHINVHC